MKKKPFWRVKYNSLKQWGNNLYWKIFVEPTLTDEEIATGYDPRIEEQVSKDLWKSIKQDMRK